MGVVPTYSLSVAAEAARTSTRKIRREIDSNVTPLRANDVKANGSGTRIGLSRNRIVQIAVTTKLVKSGVSLSNAAKAALEFSDSGDMGRDAGEVYPTAKTILAISGPDGPAVRNVDFNVSVFDEMSNDGVAIIVDLNRLTEHIDSVLNNH
jgi:hypothetical protein